MEQEFILPTMIRAGFYDTTVIKKDALPKASGRITKRFEWELPVQEEGTLYIDGNSYPIDKNHILCVKPNQHRSVTLPYRCYYVQFTVSGGRLCDFLYRFPLRIHIADPEKVKSLFTDIIVAGNLSYPGNELLMYSKFLKFLHSLWEENNHFSFENFKVNLTVSKAIRYLDQTQEPNPTLKSISETLHIHPVYLQRIFKKATGISPRQYLLNKRINNAKNLLLIGQKSYAEIALMSGFSSQSYFNYIFKKEVGMTPTEYVSDYNKNIL